MRIAQDFSEKLKSLVKECSLVQINNFVQYFNNLNIKTNKLESNDLNFSLRTVDSDAMMSDCILDEVHSSKFFGIHLD